MISLSKLLSNKYPFRNYTKNLRNADSHFVINAENQDDVESIHSPKSPIKNKDLVQVNYIDGAENETIHESFFSDPRAALSVRFSEIPEDITSSIEIIEYIKNKNPNIYFGIINEQEKNITILHPSMSDNINILLLLTKENSYTCFHYPHSSFLKIKKLWNYQRMVYNKLKLKHKKSELITIAKSLNINNIKSSMKKQEIYDILFQENFGFY